MCGRREAAQQRRRICASRRHGRRTQRRRGARSAGRAATRCRRRIGRTICELGTRRGRLGTPWRGATARAASLQTAGLERDERATRCGVPHGAITTWRATTPRDVAGDGRKTNVGRDRPAGRRPVASKKSEENGLRVGHASWASSDAAAQRNNAAASVQAAAAGDARKEDAGRERPAGQRGVAGGESGERFADWARGAGVFGRRGAAQQRGPHLRNNKRRSGGRRAGNVFMYKYGLYANPQT